MRVGQSQRTCKPIGFGWVQVVRFARTIAAATAMSVVFLGPTAGLTDTSVADQQETLLQNSTDPAYGVRNGSIIVAPVPFKNPVLGAGLAIGGAYLFQDKMGSDSSSIGLGAFKTDNGSLGYGVFSNIYFGTNEWILKLFAGQAAVNYDLYAQTGVVPISQDGTFVKTTLSYGVTPDLSFGVTFRYLDTTVAPQFKVLDRLPVEHRPDAGVTFLSVGGVADWDRSDDSLYPTNGTRLSFTGYQSSELERGNREYSKAFVTFDVYQPLWSSGVIAGRLATCGTSGSAPFFDTCSVGNTDAFRGFPGTQYLGKRSASAQLEYRQRIGKRFGVVAFGGASLVGDSYEAMTDSGAHRAAGLGVRYRLSRGFPVDFSVDGSVNDEGVQLDYIYVGQRF